MKHNDIASFLRRYVTKCVPALRIWKMLLIKIAFSYETFSAILPNNGDNIG